jgi:hypothetical protein
MYSSNGPISEEPAPTPTRPLSETEPQCLLCEDMINIAVAEHGYPKFMRPWSDNGGHSAWYLHGNKAD